MLLRRAEPENVMDAICPVARAAEMAADACASQFPFPHVVESPGTGTGEAERWRRSCCDCRWFWDQPSARRYPSSVLTTRPVSASTASRS